MSTGLTPNYSLPYPQDTDTVNVSGDMESLALAIDTNFPEITQDLVAAMLTGSTFSNGLTAPSYNDGTGLLTWGLSQDLRSTASPTFVTITAALTGNASTATALQTARLINGTSFNGTADITVTAAAGTLTGTTLNSTVVTSSLTSVGTIASGTWSGLFGAVSGANLTNLTAANLTGTIPSAVLGNSSMFIGTTSVALNRSSAALTLAGLTLTTPTIDTIVGSAGGATNTLWSATTNGSIDIGQGLTSGNINIATVGTGATGVRIGHTNAVFTLIGTTTHTGQFGINMAPATAALVIKESGNEQIRLYNSSGTVKAYIGTIGAIGSAGTDDLRIRSESNIFFGIAGAANMVLDSGGRLLVGRTASETIGVAGGLQVAGTGALAFGSFARYSNDANGPGVILAKSRGATVGTNALVSSGDILGDYAWYAHDGSAWSSVAIIRSSVDGTTGVGDLPTSMQFMVSKDGTATPIKQMSITNAGLVDLAYTPSSGASAIVEIGGGRPDAGAAYIDFHSINATDYDTRLIRNSGANGITELIHTGIGALRFTAIGAAPMQFYTNSINRLQITAAGVGQFINDSATPDWQMLNRSAAGYMPPIFRLSRQGAAGIATPNGVTVGELRFDGMDAAGTPNYSVFAQIDAVIGTNASGGAPTALRFFTAPSGGTVIMRMDIDSLGTTRLYNTSGTVNLTLTTTSTGGVMNFRDSLSVSMIDLDARSSRGLVTQRAYSNDTNEPKITFIKGRGTSGVQTIVANGDYLGTVSFSGYDGAANRVGAEISAIVDGTPGSSDMPTMLSFRTTLDGASSTTERLRINNAGLVTVTGGFTVSGTTTLATATSIGSVSSTEIGYLDGVTSGIQAQLDAKAALAGPTFTGTVVLPSTTSIGTVSNTELGYLDGVTSAIQTQIDLKAALASPALTGIPTTPTATAGTNTTQVASTEFVTTAVAAGTVPGAWTSWTPTITGYTSLGNGTVDAKYIQLGKTVHYRIKIRIGTTTTMGGAAAWTFTSPVPAVAEADQWHGFSNMPHGQGNAWSGDAFGDFATVYPIFSSGNTSLINVYHLFPSGSYVDAGSLSNTHLGTWDDTGYIQINGTYECA